MLLDVLTSTAVSLFGDDLLLDLFFAYTDYVHGLWYVGSFGMIFVHGLAFDPFQFSLSLFSFESNFQFVMPWEIIYRRSDQKCDSQSNKQPFI